MISVLILTLNEDINLAACLEAVCWSDDVVVFDSFSSDRTSEIANKHGARFVQRKFDNYASQRNAALNDIKYNNPWVLMVDADERWHENLYDEMVNAIRSDESNVNSLYHFRRKDMFMGKWLKRSLASDTWNGRLHRLGHTWIEREINEESHTTGKKVYLKGYYVHYPFNKGIAYWFERHNLYSSMEAEALTQEVNKKLNFKDLFSKDQSIKRKFLKQTAFRLPMRPFIVFCYLYFLRGGFLDGYAGYTYCRLRAIYEYMIDQKVKELTMRKKEMDI